MTTFSPESRAVLKTSMGDITLAFLVDKAPRTCEHFVRLARQGFYDGLTFHRIIKDFIVQGGCPRGDGSGGPGFTLRAEFNDTAHVRGVVSMARGTDPHSAGSQFFIVQAEARYLDSRYTAFAKVVDGLDVVDKIAAVPVSENRFREPSTPRDPVFINRIVLEGIEFDANDLAPAPVPAGGSQPQAPMAAPPQGEAPRRGDEDEDQDADEGEEPEGGAAHGEADDGAEGEAEADGGHGPAGGEDEPAGESDGDGEDEGEGDAESARGGAAPGGEGGEAKPAGSGRRGGSRRRRGRRGRRGGEGGKRGGQGS